MAKQPETVAFNLPLEIPKSDFEKLVEVSKSDAISTLKSWVPWWVSNQLGGGIMLQPSHVDHLNRLRDGQPFREATEIVKYVEKALNREDGQYTFQVPVDPAIMPSVDERAKQCGVEPKDLIQRAITIALTHPDLMGIAASMPDTMVFEPEDLVEMRQLMGKGAFYGKEVLAELKRLKALEK
jgi:hypothetical protein